MARAIEEAIYIRVNNPTLNRNIGKIQSTTHLGQSFVFHLRTKNKINDLSTATSVLHEVSQQNKNIIK